MKRPKDYILQKLLSYRTLLYPFKKCHIYIFFTYDNIRKNTVRKNRSGNFILILFHDLI